MAPGNEGLFGDPAVVASDHGSISVRLDGIGETIGAAALDFDAIGQASGLESLIMVPDSRDGSYACLTIIKAKESAQGVRLAKGMLAEFGEKVRSGMSHGSISVGLELGF